MGERSGQDEQRLIFQELASSLCVIENVVDVDEKDMWPSSLLLEKSKKRFAVEEMSVEDV